MNLVGVKKQTVGKNAPTIPIPASFLHHLDIFGQVQIFQSFIFLGGCIAFFLIFDFWMEIVTIFGWEL